MKENIKIFTLDYLINNELTEEDLYYIFDTKSLYYSLIVELFKLMNINKSSSQIIKSFTTWDKVKYTWTSKQNRKFNENLIKAYKNIYQIDNNNAMFKSDLWCYIYGPKVNK